MTREERRALWQERITQWQQSGLRLAAFARQHELDIKRLAYWRTRLKSNASGATHQTLVPLRIQPVSPHVDASAPSAPERAGRRAAAIQSLLATARLNGLEPLAWLTNTLEKLPACPDSQIDSLLPFPQSISP